MHYDEYDIAIYKKYKSLKQYNRYYTSSTHVIEYIYIYIYYCIIASYIIARIICNIMCAKRVSETSNVILNDCCDHCVLMLFEWPYALVLSY